jgi:hypothetical protein
MPRWYVAIAAIPLAASLYVLLLAALTWVAPYRKDEHRRKTAIKIPRWLIPWLARGRARPCRVILCPAGAFGNHIDVIRPHRPSPEIESERRPRCP